MATYGISITANVLEIMVTQGKKSNSEELSLSQTTFNMLHAVTANSAGIYIGRFSEDGLTIYGARVFSKVWTAKNFFEAVSAMAETWKYSVAFSSTASI